MSERIVALSTVATSEDAERIATALVERGLAACVNVVPGVVSVYRWKGAVQREEERLLVIKTRTDRFEALREALVSLHPYEVPDLVALALESVALGLGVAGVGHGGGVGDQGLHPAQALRERAEPHRLEQALRGREAPQVEGDHRAEARGLAPVDRVARVVREAG